VAHGIPVELLHEHHVKVTPFAHGLTDVISLLPAVHAVLGCIPLGLAVRQLWIAAVLRAQAIGEIINDARNVVIERTVR
jgi:hypothetical protein